ncbi:SMP-30/gluconolactonase/LRE family protein [soil metagenome]
MSASPPVAFLDTPPCRLGESPVWDERTNELFWVDIPAGEVHSLDLSSKKHRHWKFDGPAGCVSLARSGRLLVALCGSVHVFDRDREDLQLLATLEPEYPAKRLNDGKVGPDGAFWIGSMDDRPIKENVGTLFRVTADGGVTRAISGFKVSNGLAWSFDKRTMYHSDSRGPWVDAWDFDPASGAIDRRRRIRTLTETEGRPDGAACDAEGGYWSCGVSAGRLNRFGSDGRLLETVTMPVPHPTMLCFAGKDLRTAYVTSLREGLPPQDLVPSPNSGRPFAMDLGYAGVPIDRFRD